MRPASQKQGLRHLLDDFEPGDHVLDSQGDFRMTPAGTAAAVAEEMAQTKKPRWTKTQPPVQVDAKTVRVPPELQEGLQPSMVRSWIRWTQQMYEDQRRELNSQRVALVTKTSFELLHEHVRKRYSITIDDDTLVNALSQELFRVNDRSPIVQSFQRQWEAYQQMVHANTIQFQARVESLHPGSFMHFMKEEATFGNLFDLDTNAWWSTANINTRRIDLDALDPRHLEIPISDDLQMLRRNQEIHHQLSDVYWTRGAFQQDLCNAVFSTIHSNWIVTPKLVRQAWKDLLAPKLQSQRRAIDEAIHKIATDTDLYLTSPNTTAQRVNKPILEDLQSWKNNILLLRETPEDVKNELELELSNGEAAAIDRQRELAQLKSPSNLVKVRLFSDMLCMLEWTRLAEFNIRRVVEIFHTMPRVFFEASVSEDSEEQQVCAEIVKLRTRWSENLEKVVQQKEKLQTEAQRLQEDANTIRSHLYNVALRMDIDLVKFEIHEQLYSVFQREDANGHCPTGEDAFTLLMDEVETIIESVQNRQIRVKTTITALLEQEERRLISQGASGREEPRESIKRMFARMQDAIHKLDEFSAGQRDALTHKRRRTTCRDTNGAQVSPPPRVHPDSPNNATQLLPHVVEQLSQLVENTYTRLNNCVIQYEDIERPSVDNQSTVSDAWTIIGNLVRAESWIFFSNTN